MCLVIEIYIYFFRWLTMTFEVEIDFIFYYFLIYFLPNFIWGWFLVLLDIDLFMIRMLRNRFYFIITFLLWSSKLRVIQETNQSIVPPDFIFSPRRCMDLNKYNKIIIGKSLDDWLIMKLRKCLEQCYSNASMRISDGAQALGCRYVRDQLGDFVNWVTCFILIRTST